ALRPGAVVVAELDPSGIDGLTAVLALHQEPQRRAGLTSSSHPRPHTVNLVRVLVVEDEPRMSMLLQRGFREEGYAVDVAGDGTLGLCMATEPDYDAIVLDLMLPALEGIELCRRLRAESRWAPLLLLTARDGVADRVGGLDAGADDYLIKPFSFAELAARVR